MDILFFILKITAKSFTCMDINEKDNKNISLHLGRKYLALINRAGGLYGRFLTEVVSTDRTQ